MNALINHIEKLTTPGPQNISFWPKINIKSSSFTILMLNCLETTHKRKFDSYVSAMKFLTYLIFKTTWRPNSNTTEISLDSGMKYSKISHIYAKNMSIHLALVLKTFHWYEFHPFYLSILPVRWQCLCSDSDSDKIYSTKIYTSTISGLHEFLRNANNTIVLIYKWL